MVFPAVQAHGRLIEMLSYQTPQESICDNKPEFRIIDSFDKQVIHCNAGDALPLSLFFDKTSE